MSDKFNIKNKKSAKLLDLISKTDKRRIHDLYLCSCYFSTKAISLLIDDIRKKTNIKIGDVHVYVDRRSALAAEEAEFAKIRKWATSNNFFFKIVDDGQLFHTKAYALVSTINGDVQSGSLVIGSANLTGNGLTSKSGNIESLLDTQDVKIISDFLRSIKSTKFIKIDELEQFKSSDSYAFVYALLKQGLFSHKWSDDIGQYLSVRHNLNKKGKSELSNNALLSLGFNVDSASIGKRYFDFKYEPLHLTGLENLIRNYGIETYLGHWIPRSIINLKIFNDADFNKFRENIKIYWNNEKSSLIKKIDDDFEDLLNLGYVDKPESKPSDAFEMKVMDLLMNDGKLYRSYAKFEFYELPYDISQDESIFSLHVDIQEFIQSRKKKNKAMKAYEEAIAQSSLAPIQDIEY